MIAGYLPTNVLHWNWRNKPKREIVLISSLDGNLDELPMMEKAMCSLLTVATIAEIAPIRYENISAPEIT
jgi:hypothetical protein